MTFISIICFVIAVVIGISIFMKKSDILSPFRVYGITWFVAIGLTDLKLSRYQHEWTLLSWLVIVIGFSSFFLGLLIVHTQYIGKKILSPIDIRKTMKNIRINEQTLFYSIIALSILYGVCLEVESVLEGGLPIFSHF